MRAIFVILPLVITTMLRCSTLSTAGGSEIGNPSRITVMGQVNYGSSDAPVVGADVRLRSRDFCKDTTQTAVLKAAALGRNTITDATGRFVFDSVDTGDYVIEVNDGKSNAAAIPCAARGSADVQRLPVATLKPTGTLCGVVSADASPGAVYVQIVGLDRVTRVGSNGGTFVFRDIPAGTFELRVVASSPAFEPIRTGPIRVVSGDTADAGTVFLRRFAGWSHVQRIMLTTTASGADVPGTVHDFPVLVRLHAAVFDFAQARPDGSDIRFARADSTPLAFEIEQWDASSCVAALWVRVDTVRGNDGTQSILMFWGNSRAESVSNGAAVFGSDNGHLAVWHLDDVCVDATANRYNGMNYGAEDAPGIIGRAKRFDGGDSIKVSGLLGQPATLTLSGWVRTDTTIARGQEIVTLGDAVLIRADETVGGYGTGGYVHRYTRSGDTAFTKVTSGMHIAHTGWRHVAFTVDPATSLATVYVDGERVRIDSSGYAIEYAGVGNHTYIGAHGNGKFFYNNRGLIDEVRVDRVARSADWIRLCYMNQRADDRLVIFNK